MLSLQVPLEIQATTCTGTDNQPRNKQDRKHKQKITKHNESGPGKKNTRNTLKRTKVRQEGGWFGPLMLHPAINRLGPFFDAQKLAQYQMIQTANATHITSANISDTML